MNKVTRKYSRSKTFEGSLPSNLYEEMTVHNKLLLSLLIINYNYSFRLTISDEAVVM